MTPNMQMPAFGGTMKQVAPVATPGAEVAVAPPPLAPGWTSATDPASGREYWYNAETGETSWEEPLLEGGAPEGAQAEGQPLTQTLSRREQLMMEAAAAETPEMKRERLQKELTRLNQWALSGVIDQEEWTEKVEEIKADMPPIPDFDASQLQRPYKTTSIKWGSLIGVKVPPGWVENKDYDRQKKIDVGSLVAVQRSDGTIKFAQVVKPEGLFYEDYWQVVVTMKDDGSPGATRIEEGVMLLRPTDSGMAPVLSGMQSMPEIKVNEKDITDQLKSKKGAMSWLGDMFAQPVYEGGSAPIEISDAAPAQAAAPPKAVVPAGVIPKASVPAGVIPQAAVPAGVIPPPPKAAVPAGVIPPPPAPTQPPPVWQQATDPASGNPYWYNAATGETSWTPPVPPAVPPPPVPPPPVPPPVAAAPAPEPEVVKQSEWI